MTAEIVDTIIQDPRWESVDLGALGEDAAIAVLRHIGIPEDGVEIAVLGCDDAKIAALNSDFREKPTATNVLSWPSDERGANTPGERPALPRLDRFGALELGDIAISYDTCAREAATEGKEMRDHTLHLLIHGTLHLLGYDHIDDKDAALMERIETEILGKMGIANPYRD